MNKEKMKKYFKDLIRAKKEALAKLIKRNEEATDAEELRGLGTQLLALRDEINDAEEQLRALEEDDNNGEGEGEGEGTASNDDGMADDEGQRGTAANGETRAFNPVAQFNQGAANNMRNANQEAEKRAQKFAETNRMTIEAPKDEMRAILVSSGNIATPTQVSNNITDMFNKVSSIVDQVKVTDMTGCGEYQVPYQKTASTANKTAEGSAYNNSDPGFGYSKITPTTITVISSISKQVRKQTPLQYEAKVREAALIALRAKLGAYIVNGDPAATPLSEPTGVLKAGTDLIQTVEITAIDEKTLRTIALNYGGDENVVGNAVLYLNKLDLIAFGDVRGSEDKKPVYEITPDGANPNVGIITDGGLSVRYCINSNIAALSASGTTATTKTMFYGQPMNYECALFSNYEIAVSEDFQFDKGMLTIRGDVEVGGNVIHEKGFVVVTKKAAA